MRGVTFVEWVAEAERRFGPDSSKWAFKCPSCGKVTTTAQYKAAGKGRDASKRCLWCGYWVGDSPNPPVAVESALETHFCMEFADE